MAWDPPEETDTPKESFVPKFVTTQGESVLSFDGTQDGDDFEIVLTSVQTNTFAEGIHPYTVTMVSTTGEGDNAVEERYTVAMGTLEIKNITSMTQSSDQLALAGLVNLRQARINAGFSDSYSFGGESNTRMSLDMINKEIIRLRNMIFHSKRRFRTMRG